MMTGMLIMLQSCMYEKMTYLSEEDLDWMSNICKGDSFIFISNYGNTDTLHVISKEIDNSKNPFYGFNRRLFNSTYEAFARYKFKIKKQQKQIRDDLFGSFAIIRTEDDRRLGFITNFDRRYSNYNCHIDISNNRFDEFVHLKNKDSNLQNYLIVDESNSNYSRYDKNLENKITRYVINKSYGLVYYESEDGEKFFRKFN